jgi:hypothetical protein
MAGIGGGAPGPAIPPPAQAAAAPGSAGVSPSNTGNLNGAGAAQSTTSSSSNISPGTVTRESRELGEEEESDEGLPAADTFTGARAFLAEEGADGAASGN